MEPDTTRQDSAQHLKMLDVLVEGLSVEAHFARPGCPDKEAGSVELGKVRSSIHTPITFLEGFVKSLEPAQARRPMYPQCWVCWPSFQAVIQMFCRLGE